MDDEQYAYFGYLFRRKVFEARLAAKFTKDAIILLPGLFPYGSDAEVFLLI